MVMYCIEYIVLYNHEYLTASLHILHIMITISHNMHTVYMYKVSRDPLIYALPNYHREIKVPNIIQVQ